MHAEGVQMCIYLRTAKCSLPRRVARSQSSKRCALGRQPSSEGSRKRRAASVQGSSLMRHKELSPEAEV
jgi:hypothetical protein